MDSNCWSNGRVKWRIAMLCLSGMAAVPACANDDIDSAELPVVLTASRMRQPLAEAPAAITVIDRDTIERAGVRRVADLLRLVPGAVVGYNDGNWPVATLRGLSSAYASGLQVLIDGVSVYSPVFGGMLWAELPISIDDIERIEVVRGPNGASYGANSFQGVVNIITRDPVAEDKVELRANTGGAGVSDEGLSFVAGKGSWRYRATVGQNSDTGFGSRDDSMRLGYANIKANYRVNPQDSIDTVLRWAEKNKQSTTGPTSQVHPITGNKLDFQTRWSHAESSDDEWWIQFYHQQFSQRDRVQVDLVTALSLPIPGPLMYEMEQDYATWRDGIELQSTLRWSEKLRTVWGAEVRRDAARSGRFLGTAEEVSSFLTRAFGNAEWRFADRWILNSGAMFERNTLASSGWSPRVALIRDMAPGHTLRASISSARRTPTLVDSKGSYGFILPLPFPFSNYPIIAASGKVDSEKVRSKEVGYVFNIPDVALNGEARWFSDHYRGLISYRGMVDFVSGGDAVNLDEAEVKGFDLALQWTPFTDTFVRLAASHAKTTSTDLGGKYSTSVPRDTLSLLLSQSFADEWIASANYQRVSRMFWTDAGQGKKSIPAIDHLNLKLAKRMHFGEYSTEVAGVIQNALGHYRDYYLGSTVGTPDNVAQRIAFLQVKIDY